MIEANNVTYNDVVFIVVEEECSGGKKSVLYDIINTKEGNDIIIPSTFPTGEKIDIIGKYIYNQGASKPFGTVTISDEIRFIRKEAFYGFKAEKIVWSSGCKEIPYGCFAHSYITQISNIQDVITVGSAAFASSKITNIYWPSGCHEIPTFCFDQSRIKEILNIEEVTKVGASAFSNSLLEHISWPPKCSAIPDGCFHNSSLKELPNLENVLEIGENAFSYTAINKIDLSKSMVVHIGKRAFDGYGRKQIIYPYYMEKS